MARLNEILVGRFPRFLQKFYGIKGPVPVGTVAPEIMPVHSIFHGVESRYLESWNRFGAGFALAPVAAQTLGLQLRNPSGSNTLIVVEKAAFSATANQPITLGLALQATDFATPQNGVISPLDFRIPLLSAVGLLSSSATSPASLNQIFNIQNPGTANVDVILDESQHVVVSPGSAIRFVTGTVNVGAAFALWWRERFLEEQERT